ncbi:MAG: alpha/beta hydrolase [Cyclobacteriaceae bacterium]|nr:alpha/beta hydrolase [Cyclobacteriaceae bacterium]
MKNIYLIFFTIITLSFHSPVQDSLGQDGSGTMHGDTVILSTPTGEISGLLLIPAVQKKVPVVILIGGSGPTDRNGNNPGMTNNHLKFLADALYNFQVATLRYDKRGIGASSQAGIREKDLRFENYVKDVAGWISLLQRDDRFSRVIVAGHSEGSLIGMLASQEVKPSGFISISGPAEPADRLIRNQLKSQPEAVRKYIYPVLDSLAAGKTVEDIDPTYNALLRPSIQPYLISWFHYSPRVEIGKLNIPVLIIHGTTDIQVEPQNAFELLYSSKNVDLEIIEGMNHILKRADADRQQNLATYNKPDLPVMKELVQAIVNFVKSRT